jgi:nucleoside-diphosphate-sugar epimerase
LGTGKNYSLNEVADMFVKKFGCEREYLPNQNGNYRETLRENVDALLRLNWKPEDKLEEYINEL